MLEKGIYGPKGNGSVMRCLPLGLYSDPKEVVGRALVQSTSTHLSLDAAIAAALTALTAHYVYHMWVDKKGLLDFLVGEIGEAPVRHVLRDGYTDGEIGNDAVRTASWCVRTAIKCIELVDAGDVSGLEISACDAACDAAMKAGGDVDSMCAVTCGIISMKPGYKYEFARYENLMEESEFGIEYMRALDSELSKTFPRKAK
jgi:ADP-ribosylglycohydrolase